MTLYFSNGEDRANQHFNLDVLQKAETKLMTVGLPNKRRLPTVTNIFRELIYKQVFDIFVDKLKCCGQREPFFLKVFHVNRVLLIH